MRRRPHWGDHLPKSDDWLPILWFLPAGASALYYFVWGPFARGESNPISGAWVVGLLLFLGIVAAVITAVSQGARRGRT